MYQTVRPLQYEYRVDVMMRCDVDRVLWNAPGHRPRGFRAEDVNVGAIGER